MRLYCNFRHSFLQVSKFSFASGSSGRRRILLRGMLPLIPDLRYTSQYRSPPDKINLPSEPIPTTRPRNSRAMNRSPGFMVEVASPPHSVEPDILYSS